MVKTPKPYKSEYARSFQANLEVYGPLYSSNAHIREGRRCAENSHNRETFMWDTESSSSGENISQPIIEMIDKNNEDNTLSCEDLLSLKQLDKKGRLDKLIETSKKDLECLSKELKNTQITQTPPRSKQKPKISVVREKEVQTPDWPHLDITGDDSEKKVSPSPESNSYRRRKKVSSQRIFAPFGCTHSGNSALLKRTFNVRAPISQVYETALRAQQQKHKCKLQQRKKLPVCESHDAERNGNFEFDAKVKTKRDQWETEYKSHYQKHDKQEYEKALSARADLRRPKYAWITDEWT